MQSCIENLAWLPYLNWLTWPSGWFRDKTYRPLYRESTQAATMNQKLNWVLRLMKISSTSVSDLTHIGWVFCTAERQLNPAKPCYTSNLSEFINHVKTNKWAVAWYDRANEITMPFLQPLTNMRIRTSPPNLCFFCLCCSKKSIRQIQTMQHLQTKLFACWFKPCPLRYWISHLSNRCQIFIWIFFCLLWNLQSSR